jgi:hypothetical protein
MLSPTKKSFQGVALNFVLSPSDKSSPTPTPQKKVPDSSTLAFLQKQKQREKKHAQKK